LKRLLHDMNQATDKPREKDRIDKIFERSWPDLESDLTDAREKVSSPTPKRKVEDMMAEVVETVRRTDRRLDEDLRRVYEKTLRLDELSTPLDPQMGRPFVVTTGQGRNLRPEAIASVTRSRSASPPWERPGPAQGSDDVIDQETAPK
jgi:hypothetical protein